MVKRVVVVGGGFAGSNVVCGLEKDERFFVTLIDTKDYFEFTPGVLRVLVEPEHIKKIQVCHESYLKKSKFLRGKIFSINDNSVSLENGKKINFDYLVLASGSFYHEPFKSENVVSATRAKELSEFYERLKNAKRVVIVGGGLVGTEITGEILDNYPEKEITIIHSHDRILERNPLRASEYVKKLYEGKGVKFFLNEKVKDYKKKNLETDKGTKIKADLVFGSIGITPHSEMIVKSEFANLIDENKFVEVDEFLRLKGKERIFICGDVAGVKEEKTAQHAVHQARVVARNIKNFESGKKLHKYVGEDSPLVISLGKWNGLFVHKNFVLTGIIPAFMKWFIEWNEMRKYR